MSGLESYISICFRESLTGTLGIGGYTYCSINLLLGSSTELSNSLVALKFFSFSSAFQDSIIALLSSDVYLLKSPPSLTFFLCFLLLPEDDREDEDRFFFFRLRSLSETDLDLLLVLLFPDDEELEDDFDLCFFFFFSFLSSLRRLKFNTYLQFYLSLVVR